MIDIHSHILPGLDDGPADIETSLEMARLSVAEGITAVIATPHHLNGVYHNPRSRVIDAVRAFKKILLSEGIPLMVLPGSEVRLCPEVFDALDRGEIATLNDGNRYLLLELPSPVIPEGLISFVNRLRNMEIIPIIAHAERVPEFQANLGLLLELLSAGAECQVTAGSFCGSFGRSAEKAAKQIVLSGLASFFATDAHCAYSRRPCLGKGFFALRRAIGLEAAIALVNEYPLAIIDHSVSDGRSLQPNKTKEAIDEHTYQF